MWKHALLFKNELVCMPESQAHEQHIIKTAQRIEELNSWVSHDLDPWEFLKPVAWYCPNNDKLKEGISVYFQHTSVNTDDVYQILKEHLNEFESLVQKDNILFFQRC
jgi:hypothetical protein